MTTYYVDPVNGSDGNTGLTTTGAFASFARWTATVAGSEIVLMGGPTFAARVQGVGGGVIIAKNYTIRNYPDTYFELLDPTRAQAFVLQDWTAGLIIADAPQGLYFGACAPPSSPSDSGWPNCSLQLNGCSNMQINGGMDTSGSHTSRECGILVNSQSDRGIRVTKNGSFAAASGASHHIEIFGVELTGMAIGILSETPASPTNSDRSISPDPTGRGNDFHHLWVHHMNRMGVKGTANGDTGGQGIGYVGAWGTASEPQRLHDSLIHDCVADDSNPGSYGQDGGAFETFGAGYLDIDRNIAFRSAGIFETGTQSGSTPFPLSGHINFRWNECYGQINNLTPPGWTSGTPVVNVGLLLRDYNDGQVIGNLFDIGPNPQNAAVIQFGSGGGYAGEFKRMTIEDNILINQNVEVVYNNNTGVALPGGADKAVIDYNIVSINRVTGVAVANVFGASPVYRTWAQWQALGYDTHSINLDYANVDGLFEDRANRNYDLAPGSAAHDAGVVVTGVTPLPYEGSAPDIGPHESAAAAPTTTVVLDAFGRTTAAGDLASADTGGAYTEAATGSAATSEMSVDGSQAVFRDIAAGAHRAFLLSATATDTDYTVARGVSQLPPAGSVTYLDFFARVIDDSPVTAYQARIAIASNGTSTVAMFPVSAGTGGPGAPVALAGVNWGAAGRYNVRWQLLSVSPTSLRIKVWLVGSIEPAAWAATLSDSTAALQAAGAVAFGDEIAWTPAASVGTLYGSAVAMDGTAPAAVGSSLSRQVAYRYRAATSSPLSGVRFAFAYLPAAGNWDAAGLGASIELSIQTDAGGVPSGTKLGQTTFAARTLYDSAWWPVVAMPSIPQVAGTLYHVVFRNLDASPTDHYMSVDNHWLKNIPSPRQVRIPDSDWAVLVKDGAGAWGQQTLASGTQVTSPLTELRHVDGTRLGIGYVYRDDGGSTPTSIGGGATVVAADTFTRTAASFGTADTGGAWGTGGTGTSSTDGTHGVHAYTATSQGRRDTLTTVSVQDLDGSVRVGLNRVPTADSLYAYFELRWQSTSSLYRAKVRFAPGGGVFFRASRVVAAAETDLGTEQQVKNFDGTNYVFTAGQFVRLRPQMFGVSPTTINLKAWPDGSTEPGTFAFTTTDSTGPQLAGAVGFREFVGSAMSNANGLNVLWDDLSITDQAGVASLRVSELFTPTVDRVVTAVTVRAALASGSGALTVDLYNDTMPSGGLLGTVVIPAASLTLSGTEEEKWAGGAFASPIALQAGTPYRKVWSAPAGTTYHVFSVRDGGRLGGWDPQTYFADGQAYKDPGTGVWQVWQATFSDHDLPFYLTPQTVYPQTYADNWNVVATSPALVAVDAGTSGDTAALTTAIRLAAVDAGVGGDIAALGTGIALAAVDDGVSGDVAALNSGAPINLAAVDIGTSGDTATLLPTASGYSQTPGIPIEVTVFAAAAPPVPGAPMLAVLEGAREARWYDPLDDIGNGSFVIATTDRKATPENLATGNIVVFRLQGVPRYAIVIESADEVVASPGGRSGEFYEVKGRGLESILTNAVQDPTTTDYGVVPAAAVLVTAIANASSPARPVLPAAFTLGFTALADSNGLPWNDSAHYVINAGTSYLDILRLMPAIGIDVRMTPDMVLHAYRDGLGVDWTGQVVFRQGRHFRDNVRRMRQGLQVTDVYVQGKSGTVVTVRGTRPEGHIREAYVKVTSTDEPAVLQLVGQQAIDASIAATNALPVALLHGLREGEYEPFIDYDKGDWIKVDVPGAIDEERERVVALTIAATADGGYTVDADLNSIYLEELVRVKHEVDRLSQ